MLPDFRPGLLEENAAVTGDDLVLGLPAGDLVSLSMAAEEADHDPEGIPTHFQSRFRGCMDLYANLDQVMGYFDAHRGWFCRCAQPMQVEPIGENGYVLVIGRYGSFGYEVEPKIGLDLLPQIAGVYKIQTIHLPEQLGESYKVDFQAAMQLLETEVETATEAAKAGLKQLTQVDWHLDLGVSIHFPRFIHRLPKALVQRTGDRLLAQIVKQVSHRLTTKVQDDFHRTLAISVPKAARRWWLRPHA